MDFEKDVEEFDGWLISWTRKSWVRKLAANDQEDGSGSRITQDIVWNGGQLWTDEGTAFCHKIDEDSRWHRVNDHRCQDSRENRMAQILPHEDSAEESVPCD